MFRQSFTRIAPQIGRLSRVSSKSFGRKAFAFGTLSTALMTPTIFADAQANSWWGWSKPQESDPITNLGNQLKKDVDRAVEKVSLQAQELLEDEKRKANRASKWLQDEKGQSQDLTQLLTLGGFLGFSTGFFAKKIGRLMIFFVGGSVAALQYLAHLGWITIHWNKIGESWNINFDRDNDGEVTMKDVTAMTGSAVRWLTYRIPFTAGFAGGLALGLKF